ncbi:hypothetical protein [Agromyces sp. NPDC057865]|uniref:hypothetical protein n=1 Tax=Agromyces sp. NPDC057865 TaxID=3346267 RepID=UPI0036734AA9
MDQKRWQKLTEWPLAAAALAFLVAYSWQVIGNLTGPDAVLAETVIWTTWGLFLADYLARTARSRPWAKASGGRSSP